MKKTLIICLLLSAVAAAQNPYLNGTVYQVAPNGVYLNTPNGLTFVPNTNGINFSLGGASVALPNLQVGSPVQAYYPQTWQPQYVPLDYYQSVPRADWNQTVQGWQKVKSNNKYKKPKNPKAKGHW